MVCEATPKAEHSVVVAPRPKLKTGQVKSLQDGRLRGNSEALTKGRIKSGSNPNSLAALAAARAKLARCSRVQCNGVRVKRSAKGYCYFCWKRWERKTAHKHGATNDDMARLRFYKKMGPKLQTFVEECLQQPESDQFNLTQELAISRDLLDEALGLYEQAKQLPANDARRNQFLATAGQLLANASKEVRETCKVGAEVFEKSKDKYSVHTLVEVVSQIKRMIYLCFQHDPTGLDRFNFMLDNELRLPKIGNDGTTITADQDVLDMDRTVPRTNVVDAVADVPDEVLTLYCEQCDLYFNHPDTNCVCSTCNGELKVCESV